jgi:sensor domain CHASE-containing protein
LNRHKPDNYSRRECSRKERKGRTSVSPFFRFALALVVVVISTILAAVARAWEWSAKEGRSQMEVAEEVEMVTEVMEGELTVKELVLEVGL